MTSNGSSSYGVVKSTLGLQGAQLHLTREHAPLA